MVGPMTTTMPRRFHKLIEPLSVTVFFSPEVSAALTELGLDPIQAYFCSRAAPMGAVTAGVVNATFFSFAPTMVAYGIRWDIASPERVLQARHSAIRECLTRLLAEEDGSMPEITRATELLRIAVDACTFEGRPIAGAHAGLPWPTDPVTGLWHAAMILREYRGDGHIAALLSHHIDPCEALALDAAYAHAKPSAYFDWRSWEIPDREAAHARLVARGFLTEEGALTDGGGKFREMVEIDTDRLASAPFDALGPEPGEEALASIQPLVERIVQRRGVPGFVARAAGLL